MQKQTLRWIGTCAIVLSLPLAAAAQQAFTRGSVNLRAGPSSSYPLVATLAPGQPLQVMGCTSGFAWCDVLLPDGLRGWAYAGSLDYAYEEQRVPLATYGAVIGVPVVTFAIGSYWGDYYRDRPWYSQPRWWGGRPPPPPVPGWRPVPAPVPAWRPNPWPGYGPGHHAPPGVRPPAAAVRPPPPMGIRPPGDPGYRPSGTRPPGPDHGFRPGGPGRPDWNPGRPPRGDHEGGHGRGGDQGNHRGHGEGGGGDRGQGRGHGDR